MTPLTTTAPAGKDADMVISKEDKIIIQNDFEEKGWNAYMIWREHPTKKWDRVSVWRVVKNLKESGSIERRKGSGRPASACTEENQEYVDEAIFSQDEEEGTHEPPSKIADNLNISKSSVKRMIKKSKINQFKRMREPDREEGTVQRRTERAVNLCNNLFAKNPRYIEKIVWQDEKDFPLQVPLNPQNNRVYFKGKKRDVPNKNLFFKSKKQCKKVMVSAALTWYGVTKPFFVNQRGLKVNAVNYHRHLKRELFPAIKKTVNRRDWIFAQDGASSHTSHLVQDFLKKELKTRFIAKTEWPPSSPDTNPLDYYFWNKVKERVYEGRHNNPFKTEEELTGRIKQVWGACAKDTEEIPRAIRQFLPRLNAVVEADGGSIKKKFT